jgi:tripartite-type tricarboxylate transporter receptor subunit TctC
LGKLRHIALCIGLIVPLVEAPLAQAEEFPNRPVKIIVQTAAGSSLDVQARLVAEQLSKVWDQQPIIINQPGAGGLIASRALAASEPDGYTLFMAGGSVFVVLPEINKALPFDVNEFVPAGFVAEQYYGLFASTKLGVNSTAELIAHSKKEPDGLNAVAGTRGGLQHLTVEWFRKKSGAKLNMIHYPGTAQALNDMITGRVPVMMQTLLPVAGVIASGEVKLLAMSSPERLPTHPNVPTVAETVPGFRSSGWSILVGPKGMSPEIAHKINGDLRKALSAPELLKKFEQLGNFTRTMNPQQLAEFVHDEHALWGPIVREVGPKPQ